MEKSDLINELVTALSKAQSQMTNPVKDSTNPHFKNTYASLAACIEATRKPLTDNGLIISQPTFVAEGQVYVRTVLAHSSGQYIASVYPVWPTKEDPQGYGSALSYARRYSFLAILNLKDEDDDGQEGSKHSNTSERRVYSHKDSNWVAGPTEPQLKRLFAISKASGWSTEDVKQYLASMGLESSKQLNEMQYEKLCDNMQKFPKEKADAP